MTELWSEKHLSHRLFQAYLFPLHFDQEERRKTDCEGFNKRREFHDEIGLGRKL